MPKSGINNSGGAVCPILVTDRLHNYQLVGIYWLRHIYGEQIHAIIAKDQGFGCPVITNHIYFLPGSWSGIARATHNPCPGLQSSTLAENPFRVVPQSPGPGLHWQHQRLHSAASSVSDCAALSNMVLTSYRAFYWDSKWFIRQSWVIVFMAEAQNVVAAGSSDQILTLCEVRSAHRALIMTNDNDLAHADSHKMLSLSGLWGNHEGMQPPVTDNDDLNTQNLNQGWNLNLIPKSVINNLGGAVCPTLVTGRLRAYQLVGIDWLHRIYSERIPAIPGG